MNVREFINQKQQAILIVVTVCICGCAAYIYYHTVHTPTYTPTVFFTADDGKTYFPGTENDVPPITVNGKPAVRAYLFRDKATKKEFVGYMETCTPEAQPVIVKYRNFKKGDSTPTDAELKLLAHGHLYKKPGEKEWVDGSNSLIVATMVAQMKTPDGKDAEPVF